ncbi:glycosyltransferase family 1 protein [Clostridium perfringens]|uniref:glycosyltransferase family 1 protein n=1 Tax=Clostridium perfringens TaxID=1502 RepID=UPI002AC4557B|nr:glycosyltransferase family 1 protein [Clostridium perfringens]MDZ5040773.1 glycosyltransferase [Clostridium perfringens]
MYKPIRVLHIVGKMDRGGTETMIMNIYRNIDRNKIQFDFLVHTTERCSFDEEITLLGGRIYSIPRLTLKSYIKYKNELIKFFEDHKEYNIIHSHISSISSICLNIAKKSGIKNRIAHSHSTTSIVNIKEVAREILKLRLKNNANIYFACSKEAAISLFGKKYLRDNKVYIINNCINTKEFIFNPETRINMRKKLSLDECFVVGHVGRMDEGKNQKFAIEVFNKIHKKKNNSRLLLIGDGILKEELKKQVKELGIEKAVYFLGVRNDIANLLQAIDVFIFPSLFEGLPVSLVEAQASGVKILASSCISKEVDIVNDGIEFLDLNLGSEIWAEKIMRFYEGYSRLDNYQKIIDMGYDIAKKAEWIEEFYCNL